jgi:hypothetical protein
MELPKRTGSVFFCAKQKNTDPVKNRPKNIFIATNIKGRREYIIPTL